MYLRHSTVTKNGKTHTYWRLVRSVRVGRKVRQETVAQLGELDAQGDRRPPPRRRPWWAWSDSPACSTIRPRPSRSPSIPSRLRLERGRRFGDVWLAWRLWQALGLDRWLANRLPRGREDVPWDVMAAVLVIARLCEPSSELHIAEDWFRRTALDDLLGLPAAKVNDDRLYRALDHLLPHKDALEAVPQGRLGTLFQLEYDLLLYDVTSTYFEGQASGTPWPRGATRATIGPTANKSASAWSSAAKAIRWGTRSSPAIATTRRPCARSSSGWNSGTAARAGSGRSTAG